MSSAADLGLAVVGLGFGANHARVLNDIAGVRLAAVCDLDTERLEAVACATGARPFTDLDCMLAQAELDAVVVAVPARLHLRVARAAIEAGKAVLVEKPLAPGLAEGRELARAAKRARVPLMPGHIERFNPAVRELARRIANGEIGRVLQLTARRMGPIVMRKQDVNVIHDTALHDIDVMRYVTGLEVAHVYAETQGGVIMPFADSVSGLLRFRSLDDKPGPLGSLDVNWLSPRQVRDLSVLGEKGLFRLDYRAQTLEVEHRRSPSARQPSRGWTGPEAGTEGGKQVPLVPREPLREELAAFVAALRSGEPMPVSVEDGLAALAVADALTRSADSGRVVRLSQGQGS